MDSENYKYIYIVDNIDIVVFKSNMECFKIDFILFVCFFLVQRDVFTKANEPADLYDAWECSVMMEWTIKLLEAYRSVKHGGVLTQMVC